MRKKSEHAVNIAREPAVGIVVHEAMLKFKHRSQGSLAFALPSLRDARRAAEWLPRLFGDKVQVSLSWGSAGRQ